LCANPAGPMAGLSKHTTCFCEAQSQNVSICFTDCLDPAGSMAGLSACALVSPRVPPPMSLRRTKSHMGPRRVTWARVRRFSCVARKGGRTKRTCAMRRCACRPCAVAQVLGCARTRARSCEAATGHPPPGQAGEGGATAVTPRVHTRAPRGHARTLAHAPLR
jgi:hypothetical protein